MDAIRNAFPEVSIKVMGNKTGVVHSASVFKETAEVACLLINMRSAVYKRQTKLNDNGVPGLMLTGESLDSNVEVQFPKYVGWNVFTSSIEGYLVMVCLTKRGG